MSVNGFSFLRGSFLALCIAITGPAWADEPAIPAAASLSIEPAIELLFSEPPPQESTDDGLQMELGSLRLRDLAGEPAGRSSIDNKEVVLFFWSIYCRSCMDTIQEIETLRQAHAAKNIEFIAVHLFEPSAAKVNDIWVRLGLGLPLFLAPKGVRDLFSIRLLPTTLVFDSSHKVKARFDGMANSDGLKIELFGEYQTDALPLGPQPAEVTSHRAD